MPPWVAQPATAQDIPPVTDPPRCTSSHLNQSAGDPPSTPIIGRLVGSGWPNHPNCPATTLLHVPADKPITIPKPPVGLAGVSARLWEPFSSNSSVLLPVASGTGATEGSLSGAMSTPFHQARNRGSAPTSIPCPQCSYASVASVPSPTFVPVAHVSNPFAALKDESEILMDQVWECITEGEMCSQTCIDESGT
jgi:hypothetical protein